MRRLLLIGIDYYAYIEKICEAFSRLGFDVEYHPIESAGFWSKTFKRFLPDMYRHRLEAYHAGLVRRASGARFEKVVFIQVHHFSHANMEALRAAVPGAEFVLYNWDSLSTHDYRPYLRYFDRVLTFDPDDAVAIGVSYRPLFAVEEFMAVGRDKPKDLDIYFVGAVGTLSRFEALRRLWAFCEMRGLSTRFHLKCSPVVMLKLLFRLKWIPGMTLRSLDFRGIVAMAERSRAVFDFANHAQSGYTMRLIENLCMGGKVITENRRVEFEPFFSLDRFLVVDGRDFSAIPAFLEMPVVSNPDISRYSLGSWAKEVLSP